ncbi:hypothetical protein MHYP_G00352800 [Metynnis hypsauchen]
MTSPTAGPVYCPPLIGQLLSLCRESGLEDSRCREGCRDLVVEMALWRCYGDPSSSSFFLSPLSGLPP